jgi:hypothetical protein
MPGRLPLGEIECVAKRGEQLGQLDLIELGRGERQGFHLQAPAVFEAGR